MLKGSGTCGMSGELGSINERARGGIINEDCNNGLDMKLSWGRKMEKGVWG